MEVRGDVCLVGRSKKKGRGICGWWGKKRKEKRNEEVVYVGGGEKRKEKKRKKIINNVMIKTKFKNQNYVPNTIFLKKNYDFSCETKTMYQIIFFYNVEFKSGLKFQFQY